MSEVPSYHQISDLQKDEYTSTHLEHATRPEKSGADFLLERCGQVNEQFKSCVEIVRRTLGFTVEAPSLPNDDNSSCTMPKTRDEIKQAAIDLIKEQRFYFSPEKAVINALFADLAQLDPNDSLFMRKFQTSLQIIESALNKTKQKQSNLPQVTLNLTNLHHQYQELIEREHLEKQQEQTAKLSSLKDEENQLDIEITQQRNSRYGFGRILNGQKIRQRRHRQAQTTDEQRVISRQTIERSRNDFPVVDPVKEITDWIDQSEATLVQITADKISEYYEAQLIHVEALSQERQSPLPPKIIEQINDRYIDKYFCDFEGKQLKLSPEVRQLFQEAFKLAPDDLSNQDSYHRLTMLRAQFQALPYEVRGKIEHYWPHRGSSPADRIYMVLAAQIPLATELLACEISLRDFRNRLEQLCQAYHPKAGSPLKSVTTALYSRSVAVQKQTDEFLRPFESMDFQRARSFLDTIKSPPLTELNRGDALDHFLCNSQIDLLLNTTYQFNRFPDSTTYGPWYREDRHAFISKIKRSRDNLLNFNQAEAIPIVILNAYLGVPGEALYLDPPSLSRYMQAISPEELVRLKALMPEITDSVIALKELVVNNANFDAHRIANPDLLRFQEALKDDPLFIDYCSQELYADRPIAITDKVAYPSIDQKTDTILMPVSYLQNLTGQNFSSGTIFAPDSLENREIKHALTSAIMRSRAFKPHASSRLRLKTDSLVHYRDAEEQCLVPEAEIEFALTRLGFETDLFEHPYINNPIHQEFERNLALLATTFLRSQDIKKIKFVMPLLERITGELPAETYGALHEIVRTISDPYIINEVIHCLLTRTGEGDSNALVVLMVNYELLNHTARQALQVDAPKAFRIFEESDDGTLSNDRTVKSFAELLRITPEDTRATIALFRGIRSVQRDIITQHDIKDTWTGCLALAKKEQAVAFVKSLIMEGGYRFTTEDAPVLIRIIDSGKTEAFINSIRAIRASVPDFRYDISVNARYNEAEKDIYEPFDVFFKYGQFNKLMHFTELFSSSNTLSDELATAFFNELNRGLGTRMADSYLADFKHSLQQLSSIVNEKLDENFVDFLFDRSVLRLIVSQPEAVKDILALRHSGFFKYENLYSLLRNNLTKFLETPAEKRAAFFEVLVAIESSPAQEIQRIKPELFDQVMQSSDPVETYRKVSNVFIKNNLPLIGKIMSVFMILNPSDHMTAKLSSGVHLSPTLRNSTQKRRYWIIYQDLLNIHIRSGNRSLRDYIDLMKRGQELLKLVETKAFDQLTDDEIQRLRYFVAHISTLFEHSQLSMPVAVQQWTTMGPMEIKSCLAKLNQDLRVAPGQSVTDRLVEMFIHPVGLRSLNDLLTTMQAAKQATDQRSREHVAHAINGRLSADPGDLIKGIDINYLKNILQNGSVAKEFLGAGADSDGTPYDTDVCRILESDIVTASEAKSQLAAVINSTPAKSYGSLLFVIKDRGQFKITGSTDRVQFEPGKYELFNTAVIDRERHYGIRTGIATTEIDFMIWQGSTTATEYQDLCFEIAQNGYYIPVTNGDGEVIFTPEIYDRLRQIFRGVDRFDGEPQPFISVEKTDPHYLDIVEIIKNKASNQELVNRQNQYIQGIIREVLGEHRIKLKDKYDRGILGAELIDTGSTSRHTNKPNDFDFDLTLKLDDADMIHADNIVNQIKERFKPEHTEYFSSYDRGHLLRMSGAKGAENESTDIDIVISRKSELAVYGTHLAIADKLDSIEREYGLSAREQTIANIILCKKILSESKAYKKQDEGGLGGIGVENWILANDGSMLKAFVSFWNAAHTTGKRATFSEFSAAYHLYDAGLNIREAKRYDFVAKMNPSGYEATLNAIEKYWQEHNINVPIHQ